MKKIKQESGVTLVILVVMIIILLILASVGVTSWNQTIEYSAFNEFTAELQVMQSKVNELNQNKNTDIGTEISEISENQKNILDIPEIRNIIFKNKTDEEIAKIKNGFRYCSKEWIKQNLELDSIKRDYLINVEKRYVISCTGIQK